MTLVDRTFEHILGKRENAGNHSDFHFSSVAKANFKLVHIHIVIC